MVVFLDDMAILADGFHGLSLRVFKVYIYVSSCSSDFLVSIEIKVTTVFQTLRTCGKVHVCRSLIVRPDDDGHDLLAGTTDGDFAGHEYSEVYFSSNVHYDLLISALKATTYLYLPILID